MTFCKYVVIGNRCQGTTRTRWHYNLKADDGTFRHLEPKNYDFFASVHLWVIDVKEQHGGTSV